MHTKCTFICTYVQKYTHSTLMSSSSYVLAIRLQEVVKSRKQTIIDGQIYVRENRKNRVHPPRRSQKPRKSRTLRKHRVLLEKLE